MRGRQNSKILSLDEIHQAINSAVDAEGETSSSSDVRHNNVSPPPSAASVTSLEDALQAIENAPRPTTKTCVQNLCAALRSAAAAAGDDPQSWKLLALTIVRKRYHARAPAAKEGAAEAKRGPDGGTDGGAEVHGAGHGERLTFYVLCVCLRILARRRNDGDGGTASPNRPGQACACLGRLALHAGGTRDVCALVEHLLYDELSEAGVLRCLTDHGGKRALVEAVGTVVFKEGSTGGVEGSGGGASGALEELVAVAAGLLDGDLKLVGEREMADNAEGDGGDRTLQSTIHTFLPHHDRGTRARKLTQTVAELIIWSRTTASTSQPAFSTAVQNLRRHSSPTTPTEAPSSSSNDDAVITCVHSLQTSIRRFRRTLNSAARDQGFSLCSSFTMDPSSITLQMIRRGKEGDCAGLARLAGGRKNDVRVIKMIANRYSDQKKAVPMSSLGQLRGAWIQCDDNNNNDDEFIRLQMEIQHATVEATINLLRSKIPSPGATGGIILASIDDNVDGDVAAILIAAAFHPRWTQDGDRKDASAGGDGGRPVALFLGGEPRSAATRSDVIKLLNEAFAKYRPPSTANGTEDAGAATTKDVQNLIQRHVPPGSQLVLFASADVRLEARVVDGLRAEGSTVHCHVDDVWSRRMEREKAKVGDITVTLTWDNRCDLDIHAVCPNGDHISYRNKEGGGEKGGGYLDVDMNQIGESTEPVENIFFGDAEKGEEAAHGTYKIFVQNYAYHGEEVKQGDPVAWKVRVSKDGENTVFTGACVGAGASSDVTVTEFVYGGRTAPKAVVGSALISSGLVGVTSSVGSTMESLSGLMRLAEQNEAIDRVQNLVVSSRAEDETKADTDGDDSDDGNETMDNAEDETTANTSTEAQQPTVVTNEQVFNVTNRDRLYLNLSTLPDSFHVQVNQSFQGGGTLLDHAASQLAKRLIEDGIHINELRKAGYHDKLIGIVKDKMTTFGV